MLHLIRLEKWRSHERWPSSTPNIRRNFFLATHFYFIMCSSYQKIAVRKPEKKWWDLGQNHIYPLNSLCFSQQVLTKISSSQTISHQPSPHKGIYYHSWQQKTSNHGDATIILVASASSWFSETWISNPSESILPKISVSRTCHLYFLTIITIILQCKILELGSLGFKF